MRKIRLEDYQFQDLVEEKVYINIYDMSLISLCELNRYWKEFAYDILDKMFKYGYLEELYILSKHNDLLIFIKNNYKMLIENYALGIDIKDYIEINDYVTLKDWLDNYDNHYIEADVEGTCLWIEEE